jgi:peptide/nickel transport system permease protein
MLGYSARRLLQGAIVIFLVSVATFMVMRLIPGDPIDFMTGGEGEVRVTTEMREAIMARWGLDRPLHEQYLKWVNNMIRGNWGESIVRMGVPVRDMFFEAAQVTVILTGSGVAIALLIAIPAGIIAGVRRSSFFDYLPLLQVS